MIAYSVYESDNRVVRYAETLAARGDDVHVIALRRSADLPRNEVINGVHLHRISDRFGKPEASKWDFLWPLLTFTWKASKWLVTKDGPRFEVVHVHNMPDFLVFAAWYPKLRGARVILDIHDLVPELFASKFGVGAGSILARALRLMERVSAMMADRVIIANHLWLDTYTSRSAREGKCLAIINHVDEEVFHPVPRCRASSAPRIVFPGGLQWHQGLDIAIRAFAMLRQRMPDAEFDIYGDGNMKPQLLALVSDLGLQDSVRFHAPVKLRDIAKIMADADLGVVPKRADSFGNEAYSTKIMEFMSVGVPVIVSSTRVDRYYFDERVVHFFPSGDCEALAQAMHEMLSNPAKRDAMVRCAREYVSRNSWARHKTEYLDLVDALSAGYGMPTKHRSVPRDKLDHSTSDESATDGGSEVSVIHATALQSVERLDAWVRAHNYRAYDPGDGQMSFLRALTFGRASIERVLTAAVLRTPVNVRPLLGIRPHTSTKGMGYMAWGYLWLYRALGRDIDADRARHCLDWLIDHRSPGYAQYCWGNEFTFTTRAGRIPRGEPTIVWSGLIGQAFMDGYEILDDRRYLDVALSICEWIASLPREETGCGSCLSYVSFAQVSIHNSNMLGGALLARVGRATGREDLLSLARAAMRYSCARQNDDGGWYYGEAEKYHWIDNFHTGYNLDSLRRYQDSSGDVSFETVLNRGFSYFRDVFFDPDGRPKYMHDRTMPTDIQSAAQAIDTLVFFSDHDSLALDFACRTADWTIRHMQAQDGHFYYRDLGWMKVKTPMLHWGQATMFKALAHLIAHLRATGLVRTAIDRGAAA